MKRSFIRSCHFFSCYAIAGLCLKKIGSYPLASQLKGNLECNKRRLLCGESFFFEVLFHRHLYHVCDRICSWATGRIIYCIKATV
jgi:hypothetical protein